ncbi:MFS transporter [Leifsonella bigeumensis]|uniref:MFS transporter n=1 Tax=Leifsonella bigeumensis TaxID=433643 RepID=UPI0031E4849D
MGAPKTDTAFPWIGLLTLAGAIFVSVTSEFLPTGLLPEMAEGLDVSQSRIGLLVSVFAGTVVLSAAPLTSLTRRLPRKPLIVIVLVAFAISNFIGAIAPSYEIVLASRVLGGLAHGLFWAVVGAYPGHLVQNGQLARAVAITAAGGSAAFVLGVPAGTALGHLLGWRLAFTIVGVVILLLAVLVIRFLPPVEHRQPVLTGEIPVPLRKDPTAFGVVLVCTITLVMMIGHNLYYTYIVPFFTTINGFPDDAVSLLLLVYGLAGAVGLLLVGLVGGRFPRLGLFSSAAFIVVAVLVMGLLPHAPVVVVIALVVWGAAFGGAPALLQTRVLQLASPQLRDVSAAFVTTSFNIGIGGGALIGSLMLDGWGLHTLPFADVVITLGAILLIAVSDRVIRRRFTTVS